MPRFAMGQSGGLWIFSQTPSDCALLFLDHRSLGNKFGMLINGLISYNFFNSISLQPKYVDYRHFKLKDLSLKY